MLVWYAQMKRAERGFASVRLDTRGIVTVPAKFLRLEGVPSQQWLQTAEKAAEADKRALLLPLLGLGSEEEEDDDEGEQEEKEEEQQEAPDKESALVSAALTAVATFPAETGASRDHECVACLCQPKEKAWGDRKWLKLPCSVRASPWHSSADAAAAHVVCSSCCVSLAKAGLVTCPHCRASYLPPIFQGCRVYIFCPAVVQTLNPKP